MAEESWQRKGHERAHTEADGGHGGAFPPFQMVDLRFATGVAADRVRRALSDRVANCAAARRQRDRARQNAIEGDLAEAQKLKDESDAALKAYESELAAARSRAQAIGNETREKLNAAAEAERKTLEERLAVKLAEAEKTIAATRTAAMSNVRGIAAEAAAAIVQRLTGVLPDGKSVGSAVDASLKG